VAAANRGFRSGLAGLGTTAASGVFGQVMEAFAPSAQESRTVVERIAAIPELHRRHGSGPPPGADHGDFFRRQLHVRLADAPAVLLNARISSIDRDGSPLQTRRLPADAGHGTSTCAVPHERRLVPNDYPRGGWVASVVG